MSDTCTFPCCSRIVERNGFCFLHAVHFAGEKIKEARKPLPKQTQPIEKKSDKRKVLHREYVKLVRQMISENPLCEIKAPGCTQMAEGLHHVQKRSEKNLTERSNLKRACNNCNLYIENNPLEALEKGWSKSKHIKKPAKNN